VNSQPVLQVGTGCLLWYATLVSRVKDETNFILAFLLESHTRALGVGTSGTPPGKITILLRLCLALREHVLTYAKARVDVGDVVARLGDPTGHVEVVIEQSVKAVVQRLANFARECVDGHNIVFDQRISLVRRDCLFLLAPASFVFATRRSRLGRRRRR
jgi:hypothetical protein